MEYYAKVEKEGSATLIEFPDCPGCQTFAEKGDDVVSVAQEALEGWLETNLQLKRVPPVSTFRSNLPIIINLTLSAKIMLIQSRHARNMTQKELGEKVGVSQQMIARIETPDYSPGLKVIEMLLRALDVTPALVSIPSARVATPKRKTLSVRRLKASQTGTDAKPRPKVQTIKRLSQHA